MYCNFLVKIVSALIFLFNFNIFVVKTAFVLDSLLKILKIVEYKSVLYYHF